MIAADCSNYARVPSAADIAMLKALGVTRVVVCTSFSHDNGDGTFTYIGEDQCRAFEAAGFEVQEYQFFGHLKPTTRPWWLDVELTESAAEVRLAVTTASPIGIYTRKGIWDSFGWDIVAEFPNLKLWDANYGPLPRTFVPYGGWTKADMTQYHDTMDIGTGFEVDLSVYEEDNMKPFLAWCVEEQRAYFVTSDFARYIAYPAMLTELTALFGVSPVASVTITPDAVRTLNGVG